MTIDVYDEYYQKAHRDQIERLREFRLTHPDKHLSIDGVAWQYIFCGKGKDALLLLPGGTGIGQAFFILVMAFENEYRIIAPTYPPVITMRALVDGIMRILEVEDIRRFSLLGQYFGGMLSQVIVHHCPDQVDRLILSHTTTTSPSLAREYTKRIRIALNLFSILPAWLIRYAFNRQVDKLISARSDYQDDRWGSEFWRAYFRESTAYATKQDLLCNYQCVLDFYQNYAFSKDDLADWHGKVLILEADDDLTIKPVERNLVKELYPHAQVHTFPGIGHLDHVAHRQEFIPVVGNFLRTE